ncbi:MAG: hypothetical protein ACM3QU_02075 [Verrucomicrobiota bacterium]
MRKHVLATAAVAVLPLVVVSAASSAPPKRLSHSQWSTYQTAYNAYAAQTRKTVARFRFCRNSTKYNSNLDAFGRCIGTTVAREIAVTNNLAGVLNRFERKTSGNCSKALATYQGGLFFWKSAIIGVQRAINTHAADAATVEGQAANAVLSAQRVAGNAAAFTKACKPLS